MNNKVLKRVNEHLDYLLEKGYDVAYISLQGSQNYGLDVYTDEYKSDVDTKAVILPSFEEVVYNREPKSTTIVLENNEHIDLKDIRVMFDTYKKQNVNYIETLFSEYLIVSDDYRDLLKPLFENKEIIAHININQALRCIAGMSKEKLKALQHPYPTIIDKIEKFGYDPKQLHHILRMNDFMKKYVSGKSYAECLIPDNKDYLIEIKKGILGEAEAVKLANEVDAETYNIKELNMLEQDEINQNGINILNTVKYQVLKRKFKEEIINE